VEMGINIKSINHAPKSDQSLKQIIYNVSDFQTCNRPSQCNSHNFSRSSSDLSLPLMYTCILEPIAKVLIKSVTMSIPTVAAATARIRAALLS